MTKLTAQERYIRLQRRRLMAAISGKAVLKMPTLEDEVERLLDCTYHRGWEDCVDAFFHDVKRP